MPGRKAVHWRRDPAILARLGQVEPLVLEGRHNTAIAAQLGVAEATIRADRKRLNELWLEQVGGDVKARRGARIAQLEQIHEKALQAAAFDEQMERAVLLDERVGGKPIARDAKGSVTFRGNKSAALNVARQALMDAAKIEGLVVEKVSPTDGEGRVLDLASLVLAARDTPEES